MTISIGPLVDRNALTGRRRCDGCRQPKFDLRECSIPNGSSTWYRDLCGPCIDRLKRMPRLPEKGRDAAWEKALASLRSECPPKALGSKSRDSSPAEGV